MTFEQLPTTIKGDTGEAIVERLLRERGYSVYKDKTGPHPLDFICVKVGKSFGLEVKTYPRLDIMPWTGVDGADWLTYCELTESCFSIFIAFVDEIERRIYGNWVNALKGHEKPLKDKIIFPVSRMIHLRDLTDEELQELKS